MSFPKQKKPRSWRVLQDWIRHYADQVYKGKRWGKVQLEVAVAPVEVEAVLDIDLVEPFDIGQFGLESPGQISVVGLPYLVAQKLHACTEASMARRTSECMT